MDLQIFHRIAEIGQEEWDVLNEARPFSSYRWNVFGESVLADCPPTYMVLRENGKSIARASFWLKHREWLPITSKVLRTGTDRILQRWPLFVCETPLTCIPALILPESDMRAAALQKIAQAALGLAKESHAFCALFSYINLEEARHTNWPANFAPLSYSDPETFLPICWTDHESYFKQLAKSTRRNIRLHGQAAEALGITLKVQDRVDSIDEAITLIHNVETYHRVGHRPWARAMLEKAALIDFRWITAWQGERLLGCCALYGDETAQTATLLGLDYGFEPWIQVYYQLIYALVRSAIESGCKELYGGGGAYELKRRLGFKKLPDDTMVLAPTGWLSSLLWNSSASLRKKMPTRDSDRPKDEVGPVDAEGT